MSRVIFKLSFKHPNLKDTVSKNISHVQYIGTRSGVDKSITESDLQKELEKGISEDEIYANYINERPRSHGLFGKDGIEDIEKVKKELSSNTGFVWRAIVSLKEEDAIENGFDNKEKWQELIRAKMPDIAYEMGIKLENLRWCAAVHMEKGHPHTHVMFWEKEPEKIVGAVKESTLNAIRKSLTDMVFENERQVLLTEKNIMRDLLRDLAIKSVGDVVKDIKEFNDIDLLTGKTEKSEMAPKLFTEDEKKLMEDIKELSKMLPQHGRIALKFMPEDVKTKVKEIAEYILKQPTFAYAVERNLKATEELTKMYTGKSEDVEKAKNKAYADLVNRISQVILRGSLEITKNNYLIIDPDRAKTAVEIIKRSKGDINSTFELKDICSKLCNYCIKVNLPSEETVNGVFNYLNKEGYICSIEDVRNIYNSVKNESKDVSLSNKELNNCLTVLKAIGIDEIKSIELVKNSINDSVKNIEELLSKYEKEGLLKKNKKSFELTQKGYELLLVTKDLTKLQKEIIKNLKNDTDIEKLLNNKELLKAAAKTKVFDDVKLTKFDLKIKEEFGKDNLLNLKDLEKRLLLKYKKDIEKAKREYDFYKARIEKLYLNGYLDFNKKTGFYSFNENGIKALKNISNKFEFTKFDSNVTLCYIPSDGIDGTELKILLYKEIQNRIALELYKNISLLLQRKDIKEYIHVDENGNIEATPKGKDIEKKIDEVDKLISNNFSEDHIKALKVLLTQLKLEGGIINIKNLLNVLEKNIPNKDADSQYKYLIKRMDNLCKEGYLKFEEGKYYITQKGIDKRNEILYPEKEMIIKNIDYLKKIGFIDPSSNILKSRTIDKIKIDDDLKKILNIADKYYGNLDIERIKRDNIRLVNSKYLNNTYEELKTDIDVIKRNLKVSNIKDKTISNLTKTLLVSGVDYENVKVILNKFFTQNDEDKLKTVIEKAYKKVAENNAFGRLTVISKDDWSSMFRSIGINPPPDYMYKGVLNLNNSLGLASIVNQIWKAAWNNLEFQKNKTVMQAEYMKKQLLKENSKSKQAIKEEIKKNKSSSLFRDDELENI